MSISFETIHILMHSVKCTRIKLIENLWCVLERIFYYIPVIRTLLQVTLICCEVFRSDT